MTPIPLYTKPLVTTEGDDRLYLWPDQAIVLTVANLREDRQGDLHAHLNVFKVREDGEKGNLLFSTKLNLMLDDKRYRQAILWQQRHGTLDWEKALEFVCFTTRMAFNEGTPSVDLATVTYDAHMHRYLIEDVLSYGNTSTIYADGGGLKSWTMMAIGLATLTGKPVGPFIPTEQGPVMYLDWETTAQDQHLRYTRACAGLGLVGAAQPRGFHYKKLLRPLVDEATELRREMDRKGVKLVLVDSLGAAIGSNLQDEEGVIRFYSCLRTFERTTRLVATHITKAGREDTIPSPFGSVYIHNFSRAVFYLKGTGEDREGPVRVALKNTKLNEGRRKKMLGVEYFFPDDEPDGTRILPADSPVRIGRFDPLDDADTAVVAPLGQRIRRLLGKEGMLAIGAIAEATGSKESSVRSALSRMQDVQAFETKVGRGGSSRYGLVDIPRDEELF